MKLPKMTDWNEYFSKTRPPSNLDEAKRTIQDFAVKHRQLGRNIVLVTSGGTTVPIESNTVRFVDNFSQGTRGALSAEYFLMHGYAVIFLHRQRSYEPFCRHFEGHNALDLMELQLDTSGAYRVTVDETRAPGVQDVVRRYKEVQNGCLLLKIGFMTLSDYLFLLRASAEALSPLGPSVMFYLAAAVSDFYIPEGELPEHKIQSSEGALKLQMTPTPKMMSPLVKEWARKAFVVSFKLESDVNIISRKAREALQKYNHQVVIANILQTRRKTVVLVTPYDEVPIWMSDQELEIGKEIEEKIVIELTRRHLALISGSGEGDAGSNGQQSISSLGSNNNNNSNNSNSNNNNQNNTNNNNNSNNNNSSNNNNNNNSNNNSSSVNMAFSPTQYQTGTGILGNNNSSSVTTASMPGLAPINMYHNTKTQHSLPNVLLQLKTAQDEVSYNGVLGPSLLKRSGCRDQDTGTLTQEMQDFIKEFKARRVHLGYTQDDVGKEMSALNGPTYSQSFISRFEGKQLGMKAADRMRPILEAWIQSKEDEHNSGNKFTKIRRKRTSFSPEYLHVLNEHFAQNPKPSVPEMQLIAEKMNLDFTTVKVWFGNKKQSLKRLGQPAQRNSLRDELHAKRKLKTESDLSDVFPMAGGHCSYKTLPVSTPTGTVNMPFYINQNGEAIPIVTATDNESSVLSASQDSQDSEADSNLPSSPQMNQQIVHLSQLPLLAPMTVMNHGLNSTDAEQGNSPTILSHGRIIHSNLIQNRNSVVQISTDALSNQHLGHSRVPDTSTLDDNVMITSSDTSTMDDNVMITSSDTSTIDGNVMITSSDASTIDNNVIITSSDDLSEETPQTLTVVPQEDHIAGDDNVTDASCIQGVPMADNRRSTDDVDDDTGQASPEILNETHRKTSSDSLIEG